MGDPDTPDGSEAPKPSFVSTRGGEAVDVTTLIYQDDPSTPTDEELQEALEYIRQKKAAKKREQELTEADINTPDKDPADLLSSIKTRFRRVGAVSYRHSLADSPTSKWDTKQSSQGAGAGAVVNNIKPPELASLDPKSVIAFLDKREDYEQRISALSESSEVPIHLASWKLSVQKALLKTMFTLGMFRPYAGQTAYADLTDDHVREAILAIAERERSRRYEGKDIAGAMTKLRMDMKIQDPQARVVMLVADFNKILWQLGMDSYLEDNPKSAIRMLTEALRPLQLRAKIRSDIVRCDNLGRDFMEYIGHVQQKAIQIDAADACMEALKNETKREEKGGASKNPNPKNRASSKRDPPLCLWKPHADKGIKHWLNECEECPKSEKKALYEKLRKDKDKDKSSVKKIDQNTNFTSDVIEEADDNTRFHATIDGLVKIVLCGDGGSCVNIIPLDKVEMLKKIGKVDLTELKPPRDFNTAVLSDQDGNRVKILCGHVLRTKTLAIDCRHAKRLVLRNVQWMVPTQPAPEALLGRPALNALGLNTSEILRAAAANHKDGVDFDELLPKLDYVKGSIARVIATDHLYYSDRGIEDAVHAEKFIEIGPEDEAEKARELEDRITEAEGAGMVTVDSNRLRSLLQEFDDVTRVRLGNDPPADVEPMKVELDDGAKPVVAKFRRYSPDQRKFLEGFVNRLEQFGFVRPYKHSQWAAAPVLVPKSGLAKYRLTFDLRSINAVTKPVAWVMANIEAELADLSDTTCFAKIDFPSGYWQLPLHKDSQPLHGFVTHKGTYVPTRVMQGGKNGAIYFQQTVEPCFASIRQNMKAWLDDFLLYASNAKQLIEILRKFFEICRARGLKISVKKSVFFTTEVRWCGRILDKEGMRYDPRNLEALTKMEAPESASELSQYVNCLQWMSQSIPMLTERVRPLRDILEKAFLKSGKRTSKSIKSYKLLDLGWTQVEQEAYESLLKGLTDVVKLAYPKEGLTTCVHTDASDKFWAGVVTQCNDSDLNKLKNEQSHNPLAFFGGSFDETQSRWSTFEREAFAIYQVFIRADYLLMSSSKTVVYTDHRNLLFVFHPRALQPITQAYVVAKVQRWALYLSRFEYEIEHVSGDVNDLPDLLTRWAKGYRKTAKICRICISELDIVPCTADKDFTWPNLAEVRSVQLQNKDGTPREAAMQDGVLSVRDKIWIPSIAHALQLTLMVIAHTGVAGHRGVESTMARLQERFYCKGMRKDAKAFIQACIHCVSSRAGDRVPRPLQQTLHADAPNEILHFDYLFMGPSAAKFKYILVLRDDLSSYVWLVPCTNADAETTARSIAKWINTFTVMKVWSSDQGSHFKNGVMEELATKHGIHHHFVTAYSPWANGSVERCMREIRRATEALMAEHKAAPQDWPDFSNIVQQVMNNAPLRRLGMNKKGDARTPLEVMTGLLPNRKTFDTESLEKPSTVRSFTIAHAMRLSKVNDLQSAFEAMHREVAAASNKARQRQIDSHNRASFVVNPNFEEGDLVLVRRAADTGHKLKFRWTGPQVIMKAIKSVVYIVRNLIDGSEQQVHATRIALYRHGWKDKPVSRKLLDHAVHTQSSFEVIEEVMDIAENDEGIWFQLKWQGLPDKEDFTWQKLEILKEDVPEMLQDFLKTTTFKSKAKRKAAQTSLGLHKLWRPLTRRGLCRAVNLVKVLPRRQTVG